jgi:response regulator RpfG family c-di-GMP phosphodiesterase
VSKVNKLNLSYDIIKNKEQMYLQNTMQVFILYVDQHNNNISSVENKMNDNKYNSPKYKNYCNKRQKNTQEIVCDNILSNDNTNVSSSNDEKIDLYNDK